MRRIGQRTKIKVEQGIYADHFDCFKHFDRCRHISVCSTGLGVILNLFYKNQQFLISNFYNQQFSLVLTVPGLAVSDLVGQCSAISATVILFR